MENNICMEQLRINKEYPRLFLNAEELAALKRHLKEEEQNIYGISWKGEFHSLIRQAEAYLEETQIMVASNGGPTIPMDAYPVLRDPNDAYYDPIYIEASTKNGVLVEHPHLGYGCLLPLFLQGRLETLSLAYLLTGDTRYADRAIGYMMQISDWEWWGDKYWLDTYAPGAKVDASVAWTMQGVAVVYDLCYDILTSEQKKKIENAIIEKGLAWLMCGPADSIINAHLMFIGGMLTGIAAIINEENAKELKPYMEHALTAAGNALSQFAYSGNTEGHYYTGYGLEYFLPGIVHFCRATGFAAFTEHPFLNIILPYWTTMFAAPGSYAHPNYSDGIVDVWLKFPMALIAKMTGNPLANYFLVRTGAVGNAFANLIYLKPDPMYEEPADLVGVVDSIGYGVLRTGFGENDQMFVMKANNSQMNHNHYDQNAVFYNVSGDYLIADPGHGSYYLADRTFYTMKGHSTILVDGNAQTIKGTAFIKKLFTGRLYGYLIGSAPDAYGTDSDGQLLQRFDRHAIQVNHPERAYYIVIDDLCASKEHVYGWQMYNGDRAGFEADGEKVPAQTTAHGNRVSMALGNHVLKISFVDKCGLDMADKIYGDDGYTFVANSTAKKSHQFMTVISSEVVTDGSGLRAENAAGEVAVTETYDDEKVLGALINYAGDKQDLVIFNRTAYSVSAGKLTTDGQQASALGLVDGKITECFAATKASILTYNGISLFSSEKKLNIVADAEGWHVETEAAQEIVLNIGTGEVVIAVNGEKVDAVAENGRITLTLKAGATHITKKY